MKINKFQYGYKVPTSTWKDIGNFLNKGAETILYALQPVGDAISSVVSNLPLNGTLVMPINNIQQANSHILQNKQRKLVFEKDISPALSPTNHIVAWTLGSFNPKVGQLKIVELGPLALLGSIATDMIAFKYTPKINRSNIDRGLAAAGNKGAKGRVIAREIDHGVAEATKNGQIEVTSNYFNAPDKWYRIANRPEKMGIELEGKNITTRDADYTPGTPNRWRADMQDTGEVDFFHGSDRGRHLEPGKGANEGYFVFMPGSRIYKTGSAHGNTSLASKGSVWKGGVASNSELFPIGIIEGQAPSVVPYGRTRGHFVNTPWEEVPTGGRIGFHTGEMPMSNLGWFLRLPNGRYTYEPIILEKRITFDPNKKFKLLGSLPRLLSSNTYPWYTGPRFSILSVVNPDGTVNPRLAMRVQHTVADHFGQGAHRMENRLENSRWHKNDPTTYDHTRNVALSAWRLPIPEGFTKQDLMIAALGHDFGKMLSGEGHAQIGADLARQVFPDLTDALYTAIAEHMGTPTTPLGLITKAADITNGRPFTYLQQYAPGLYSQYLGNTIYRVTQPNGKIRLLLPSHTEAKPREITLEPLGNNKFYTHMRIWDDVDKQVPGKINDVEKNNLFLALYETLPEEGEILFPQSGPGFYGTRGTVAGLQRLSRDSRFQPGTSGTLLYLDKDGKTVRTYNGTSFIKKPYTDERYSREPVIMGDEYGAWEVDYPDYVKHRVNKVKLQVESSNGKVRGHDYDAMPGSIVLLHMQKQGFHPYYVLHPGANLRGQLAETTRRLDNITGRDWVRNKQMYLDGTAPYYLGYFDEAGIAGSHNMKNGINLIEPNPHSKMHLDMMHEGISHGTDNYMPLTVVDNYQSFVDKVMNHPDINPDKTTYRYKGWSESIPSGTDKWYELRATMSEIRKDLYDRIAKDKGIKVNESTIESLRPEFERLVDAMTLDLAAETLRKANSYGRVYGTLGPTINPNFLGEFKGLLKVAPAAGTPLIFKYNEEK